MQPLNAANAAQPIAAAVAAAAPPAAAGAAAAPPAAANAATAPDAVALPEHIAAAFPDIVPAVAALLKRINKAVARARRHATEAGPRIDRPVDEEPGSYKGSDSHGVWKSQDGKTRVEGSWEGGKPHGYMLRTYAREGAQTKFCAGQVCWPAWIAPCSPVQAHQPLLFCAG